jgi:hypothetical protein
MYVQGMRCLDPVAVTSVPVQPSNPAAASAGETECRDSRWNQLEVRFVDIEAD